MWNFTQRESSLGKLCLASSPSDLKCDGREAWNQLHGASDPDGTETSKSYHDRVRRYPQSFPQLRQWCLCLWSEWQRPTRSRLKWLWEPKCPQTTWGFDWQDYHSDQSWIKAFSCVVDWRLLLCLGSQWSWPTRTQWRVSFAQRVVCDGPSRCRSHAWPWSQQSLLPLLLNILGQFWAWVLHQHRWRDL